MNDQVTLRDKDIAIIGMSGRFSGAEDISTFWSNLAEGLETITTFSEQELRESGVDEESIASSHYIPRRGILGNAEYFDAHFFDITPRDAEIMDPQHRAFLESSWHAFEDAGYVPASYPGKVGVFGGTGAAWHLNKVNSHPSVTQFASGASIVTNNDKDYVTTRVSYKLDLKGPSVNVQTACSTAMVASFLFDQVDASWQREKRFNQDAAHELRTPLAFIKLNAQNALKTENVDEKNHDLAQIEQSIVHSERTIAQLLTLAKIESGLTVDLTRPVDAVSLLRGVIAELAPLALKQGQEIMLDATHDHYLIKGNDIFLNCLFRNLIDNAIRYSGEGANILAEVVSNSDHVKIVISDSGRGMSEEDIERIFERFFRARETQNKVQGAGLGMAIVERVIALHEGTISVWPQEPGLAFIVTLPNQRFGDQVEIVSQ